jgi:uncharacterized RDD family membrane protein YckC
MNLSPRQLFLSAAIAFSLSLTLAAFAQEPRPPAASPSPEPAAATTTTADLPAPTPEAAPTAEPPLRRLDEAAVEASDGKSTTPAKKKSGARTGRARAASSGNERVAIGHSTHLPAGEKASAVVAVFGSATSDGEVSDAVVAVLGNSRATGPVGDSVVAVLGNVYVNSKVGDAVVAVLGNVELGPKADVGGDVVAVGGKITKDPTAVVRGQQHNVSFLGALGDLEWLRAWFKHCLLLGRPLAIGPHLGWVWIPAFGFLALYVVLALLFSGGMEKCVLTLETQPGYSILAALLSVLLAPIATILLAVTGVGLFVIPFLVAGMFFATLFGKAVMLAWLGRRITRLFGDGPLNHIAMAVLFGGIIVLGIYLVPFLGFIVFKLLAWIGLGVVIYTLLLGMKREKRAPAAAVVNPPPAVPAVTFGVAAGPVATEGVGIGAGAPAFPLPAATPAYVPAAISAASLPRAGFWIRMAALLLDMILLGIVLAMLHHGGPTMPLLLAAYGAVMWKLKGTTIGGIVCGLKVVRLDDREIDWATAIVRALGCFLSLAVVGLGFIWVAFDDEKQSWHDKIAGTTVVRLPKGVSLL